VKKPVSEINGGRGQLSIGFAKRARLEINA